MQSEQFDVPVALLVYNRPRLTAAVIEPLRLVRPQHMLVVADGPNPSRPDDVQRCQEVADVLETIDWPCTIEINRSPTNLGCRKRVQTGLDWVFGKVERAIIVEDDCVLDPSFFPYCRELLDRYATNDRVQLIGATNGQVGQHCTDDSYYFSRYPMIWGWAAWRRTWQNYDHDLDSWPKLKVSGWLDSFLSDPLASEYWSHIFDRVRAGFDTWDYSLTFSCWKHDAVCISPAKNLVTNIGCGPDATHTNDPRSIYANLPREQTPFPLRHPACVAVRDDLDQRLERLAFSGTNRQLLANARYLIQARRNSPGGG